MRRISSFSTLAKSSFIWTSTMERQTRKCESRLLVSRRHLMIHILEAETIREGTIRKEETLQCPMPDLVVGEGRIEEIPGEEEVQLRAIAGRALQVLPIKAEGRPNEEHGRHLMKMQLLTSALLKISKAMKLLRTLPMIKSTRMSMTSTQIP